MYYAIFRRPFHLTEYIFHVWWYFTYVYHKYLVWFCQKLLVGVPTGKRLLRVLLVDYLRKYQWPAGEYWIKTKTKTHTQATVKLLDFYSIFIFSLTLELSFTSPLSKYISFREKLRAVVCRLRNDKIINFNTKPSNSKEIRIRKA